MPGALRDRDPIEILEAGIVVAYGYVRYRLIGPKTAEGSPLIARIAGVEVPHAALCWYLDLAARVANEQGVRCVPSFDAAGRLRGFAPA